MKFTSRQLLLASVVLSAACSSGPPTVVIVGGGVAGMAAAIEAAPAGKVVLLEADPNRLGGSAWWSQGVTAVPDDTQWPGDDPARVRYRERVQPDVLDWTAALGITWIDLPDTSGGDIPLKAPVGGGRRLSDTFAQLVERSGVEVHLGAVVTDVSSSLRVTTRSGERWDADAVILATGGWAADLPGVKSRLQIDPAVRVLNGAMPSSRGDAEALAADLNASTTTPARAVLYGHGTPDPAAPERALMVFGSNRLYFVDQTGAPQPWLGEGRGNTGQRLMDLPGKRAWAILDGETLKVLRLQGSAIDRRVPVGEVASQVGHMARDLETLAKQIDVPVEMLRVGVAIDKITDERPLLPNGPYVALPLFPTTAKSISGLRTDLSGQVLDGVGQPIAGLYAAGEAMGFGHPYGDDPVLDSSMVAGAILTGRIVGATVRARLRPDEPAR
ncbi:MAG: FAD-dependent oxidoreductase [Myxococcota bacterium]